MRILSFAWTTPAVLDDGPLAKSCTRRAWQDKYARLFHAGDDLQGYDKNPRVHGKPVRHVRLTADPYRENTRDMPDADYVAEGFAWFDAHPDLRTVALAKLAPALLGTDSGALTMRDLFDDWRESAVDLWVVRFERLERY